MTPEPKDGTLAPRACVSSRCLSWPARMFGVLAAVVPLLLPTPLCAQPCVVPDNGTGTVTLPPAGCDYLSPDEVHMIIDGLPPGTTIELDPIHMDFMCQSSAMCSAPLPPGECEQPGGTLGGDLDCFESWLQFDVNGTGVLLGFHRTLVVPVFTEVHTGPRIPGDPVQTFPTEMYRLYGELFGDPDFCTLRVMAGMDFGLPGPGQTTLTDLGGGLYNVDSFFDVTYQIEFEGCPGSILDGFMGITTATIRMRTGESAVQPEACCLDTGDCVEVAPADCGGTPQGPGTACSAPTACCLPSGACSMVDPLCCDDMGGTVMGFGMSCLGDYNGDGIDDVCDPDLCKVPDNGTGTVNLPPDGCDYLSPQEVHQIIDGLPPGTTIELDPIHMDFINVTPAPGGTLGGEIETFESTLDLTVTGTGSLAGFNRHLAVPVTCEVHTGPRTPGDPVQAFPADMYRLQGELFGDPDFCTLRVTGGTDFSLPSPGQTRLTQLPDGDFAVDSFFDITYQIEFEGCPGSQLSDYMGTTTATIRMETGHPVPFDEPCCLGDGTCSVMPPTDCLAQGGTRVDACWGDYNGDGIDDACDPDLCAVPDNGTGTVTLPPAGCDYLSPDEVHMIIDGLPPGTTIELEPIHMDFICTDFMAGCTMPITPGNCEVPGGSLGGHGDCFESTLDLTVTGTGSLAGFNRHLAVPVFTEVHTGPRSPGDPVQSFASDIYRLQGELFGDPDFCTLRVTAGSDFGLPSPGATTLTQLPTGDFAVDSFFDITYQIEFEGCPASQVQDYMGTTTATIRMQTGHPAPQAEACCLPNGTCMMAQVNDCLAQNGTPQGSGTVCLGIAACQFPDLTCVDMDAQCCLSSGGTPKPGEFCLGIEACCVQDGGCEQIDALICEQTGGNPQGPGTTCLGIAACHFPNLTCVDMDAQCCLTAGGMPKPGESCMGIEACCLPDDTCQNIDALICLQMGGDPMGQGTVCTEAEACCIGDGVCLDLDPLCCAAMGGNPQGPGTACVDTTIACCLPDGTCFESDPLCCDDLGGTPGYQPHCLGDNNGNQVDDACEPPAVAPARPLPDSAFDIAGTLVTCGTDSDCREGLNTASDVYCVPPETGDPPPGTCYVARNRYVSIDPNPENDGVATARRVSLDTGGGSSVVLGWISEPIPTPVSGPEVTPQLIARLVDVDARHYRDWSLDAAGGPWIDSTLHLGDCEVSPGYTYLIQAIELGEDVADEAAYSEVLALPTVRSFGDVSGSSAGQPPDSVRNFKDISAVVRGFQGIQLEPKTWLDLQGANATPELPDFSDINFKDIDWAVKGFQGGGYPFAGPCDCPGQACP